MYIFAEHPFFRIEHKGKYVYIYSIFINESVWSARYCLLRLQYAFSRYHASALTDACTDRTSWAFRNIPFNRYRSWSTSYTLLFRMRFIRHARLEIRSEYLTCTCRYSELPRLNFARSWNDRISHVTSTVRDASSNFEAGREGGAVYKYRPLLRCTTPYWPSPPWLQLRLIVYSSREVVECIFRTCTRPCQVLARTWEKRYIRSRRRHRRCRQSRLYGRPSKNISYLDTAIIHATLRRYFL